MSNLKVKISNNVSMIHKPGYKGVLPHNIIIALAQICSPYYIMYIIMRKKWKWREEGGRKERVDDYIVYMEKSYKIYKLVHLARSQGTD